MHAAALFLILGSIVGNDFFERKIRPVLVEKCYGCHNANLKAPFGGLRLDTGAGLQRGGDSGAVIAPGKPAEQSLLYKALLYTPGSKLQMPPSGRLADGVLEDFKAWIESGAADPRVATPAVAVTKKEQPPHWAFQPLKPASKTIDEHMAVGAPLDKRAWIRRVTFDLTGLPPTPAEISAYLADGAAGADKRVIERLLASPHYGERWARHWLDLVRFAETNGHEYDNDKLDAWRYRDYVIRAFNEDLPYDRLVREHLAGDLLREPRISRDGAHLESPIASGMLWFGEVLNSATDSVKTRADVVDNQVDVVSKAFLGLTLSCARCHDHKFDPLPTREYYGIAGMMHSTYFREAVIDSPAREAAAAAIREMATAITAQMVVPPPKIQLRTSDQLLKTGWHTSGQAFVSRHGLRSLTGSLTSDKFKMPKFWIHVLLRGDLNETNGKDGGSTRITLVAGDYKSQHIAPVNKARWQWKSIRMTLEHARTCYFEVVDRDTEREIELGGIVFSDDKEPPSFEVADATPRPDLQAQLDALPKPPTSIFALISGDEEPRDVRVHIRGSHENLGDVAPRGFLKAVGEASAIQPLGSGRLELAEWIASPRNPLTARVFVNRVWKHHFGTGIVKSVDNFGMMGEAPSNLTLLDTLAQGFIDSGWSIKWLHRAMLASKYYRGALPVRRLEAEAISDSLLAVSGGLNRTLYGPGILPFISKYQDGRGKPKSGALDGEGRRSIYINIRRNFLPPMFLAFDYPLPISTIGGRGASTVPSQALLMMNNEFVEQQAKLWAERATREEPDESKRIAKLYNEAFGRDPAPQESTDTLAFAKANSWADLCHVLFNSAEFLYVQ